MLRFFTNNDMVCKDCKAEEVYKVIASFLSNLEITSMQTVNVEYETDTKDNNLCSVFLGNTTSP